MEVPASARSNARFNRYMVECEFCFTDSPSESNNVLIDTWWNVNAIVVITVSTTVIVLIDTWWNVNAVINKALDALNGF